MPTGVHAAINTVVWIDKGRMSGEPCFRDTRVPIQTLLDHLISTRTSPPSPGNR